MKRLVFKVVGVTYENRQETLAAMHGTEVVRLEPEPENKYDPNAIAVKVAFPPEAGMGICHVGYVPRDLAAQIAPAIEGEPLMAEIVERTGGFELWNGQTAAYGLQIRVEVPE